MNLSLEKREVKSMKKILLILLILICFIPSIAVAQNGGNSQEGNQQNDADNNQQEQTQPEKNNRIALVIGISKYNTISGLKFAASDASAVREALEVQGEFNVKFLSDTSMNKPTKANIIKTLDSIKNIADKPDSPLNTFVLYFAGRGFNVDGSHYLAPSDAKEDDIANTGISLLEIYDRMSYLQNRAKVMVFVDAFRGDPKKRESEQKWGDINFTGVNTIYSASSGQMSLELPELGQSLFSYHLVNAIKGLADIPPHGDEDGFISFDEVNDYISAELDFFSQGNPYNMKQYAYSETNALSSVIIGVVNEAMIKLFANPISLATMSKAQEEYTEEYYAMSSPIYEKIRNFISNNDIQNAIETIESQLMIIRQSENELDLEKDKEMLNMLLERLKKVLEVRALIDEAQKLIEEDKFIQAMDKYSDLWFYIHEKGFNQFIQIEGLTEKASKLRIASNIQEFINAGDDAIIKGRYDDARANYNTAVNLLEATDVSEYITKKTIEKRKDNIAIIIEARKILKEAEQAHKKGDYREELNIYINILTLLEEHDVDKKFIDIDEVRNKREKLTLVINLTDKLIVADGIYERGDYEDANSSYRDILQIIKDNELEDYFPVEEIEMKIENTPMETSIYIGLNGGAAMDFVDFGTFRKYLSLSVSFRSNRVFAWGLGLSSSSEFNSKNYFKWFTFDAFMKFSFMNTLYIDHIFRENYFQIGASVNLSSLFGVEDSYNYVSGYMSLNYGLGFFRTIGFFVGAKAEFIYYFDDPNHQFAIPAYIILGIVWNF
jgi:tetratricopeptide (TPR) repeat protein